MDVVHKYEAEVAACYSKKMFQNLKAIHSYFIYYFYPVIWLDIINLF